jgi:ATP-dependent DNA helicase RecG
VKLTDPIEKLPLVGPTYTKRLQKLGITTIEDLLFHFPFRYDDFSLISQIARVQPGETVTIRGVVEKITSEYTKHGKKIQKALVSDNSGQIEAIWFNQPYLAKTIKVGENYNFSGNVNWFGPPRLGEAGRQKTLVSPEHEKISSPRDTRDTRDTSDTPSNIHTGRLVPVYNETYGVSSKWLRSRIKNALEVLGEEIQEFLPEEMIKKEGLMAEKEAVFQIHFPQDKTRAEVARYRLAFDELFLIQLSALLRKREWQKKTLGHGLAVDQEKVLAFLGSLPFAFTGAQKRSLKEILNDLAQDQPMNRLLQGDVGSGKTVVAAASAYVAFLNGFQTLLMAPTEILANQHYATLKTLLGSFGVQTQLITSARGTRDTRGTSDAPHVIVGTHALLHQQFDPTKVGLVIVDEQHRFGVEQRLLLSKKGHSPHFLTMTATPIPRTIALTLFGDLDLSVIDELPVGRLKVKTWVVPKEKRQKAYEWIRSRIKDTPEQAFIICPLIEESETLTSVKAATKEFSLLSQVIFPDLRLGLLHGRLKAKERDQILNLFKDGKLDILVATPVVEVGIDIPNATIMLIEAADRFGLAQLHQLRGRVGRSHLQSFCFLFTENENPLVTQRLKALETTFLGGELAEIDLKLRGPGEIYGTRQHGFPDLRIASFTDLDLIQKTRKASELVISNWQFGSVLKQRLERYKIEAVSN